MITQENKNDIAIIGMSCVFPGSKNIHDYWKNIRNGVDAITDVPENRWDSIFYDPSSNDIDRFYCRKGGFIDDLASFNPIEFGVVPATVEGTEPDHLIALKMAKEALSHAGVFHRNTSLEKAGIVLGKGNYIGNGVLRLIEQLRTSEHLVNLLKSVVPDISPEALETLKKGFRQQTGMYHSGTAMGLIPNLAASLIANRLNFGGVAYTVDAACASSLIAVDHAVQELRSGRSDLMLAGGIHLCQNESFYSVFTQLGALSRNQRIRPFDQRADGLLIGEGCGMIALKKLDKALKDGDTIYALIKGVGVSSDGSGTSLMKPSITGQKRAILRAWSQAGIDPSKVGYIEAHGTGTPTGDTTEIKTLRKVFCNRKNLNPIGLGSVKSMIGHTMPAAGIAGLIKTTLALYHGELPPTLHCDQPISILKNSGLDIISEAQYWDHNKHPRRAGINAFGFGGINTHLVIEGFDLPNQGVTKIYNSPKKERKDKVIILARSNDKEITESLKNKNYKIGSGNHRIAIFNPTPERIRKAIKIVKKGRPWRNRGDIWYTPNPLLANNEKLCFLFPGLDALEDANLEGLRKHFDIPKILPKQDTSELIYSGVTVFENSILLDSVLKQLGILPDCIAGHSLGEWVGYYSSGIVDEIELMKTISKVNLNSLDVPDVYFLAIGAGVKIVTPLLESVNEVFITHDNCKHQSIVCGARKDIDEFRNILLEKQILNQILPFKSGFHSPFFKEYSYQIHEKSNIIKNKPHTPLWSSTSLNLYPEDINEIRKLNEQLLVNPVLFRKLIQKLYNEENVKVFIQIGSGGLISFTDDILKNKDYMGISASYPKRNGINQIQRVIASLFVEGKPIDLNFLNIKKGKNLMAEHSVMLQLGSPMVKKFETSLNLNDSHKQLNEKSHKKDLSVFSSFQDTSDVIQKTQNEINNLLTRKYEPSNQLKKSHNLKPKQEFSGHRFPRDFKKPLALSIFSYPELMDHTMYNQKEGWPYLGDLLPVVPITMLIELMADAVHEEVPNLKILKISNVQVFKWTIVTYPVKTTITGKWKDQNTVRVTLGLYALADITVGHEALKNNHHVSLDIGETRIPTVPVSDIYKKNYMFHGPKYQGIKQYNRIGSKGMEARIQGVGGKGSLLDNAGQVFGLWSYIFIEKDNVAFPVKIKEIQFFEDYKDPGVPMNSTFELVESNDDYLICNMVLTYEGRPWARILGWQNRRLGFTKKLYDTSVSVLDNKLSDELYTDIYIFEDHYKRMTVWDFIVKRYLNTPEKKIYNDLPLSKSKKWLMGRVAAKDAVRSYALKNTDSEPLFPACISIKNTKEGKPYIEGEFAELPDLGISIAHKNKIAVALVSKKKQIGIDIETIERRDEGFINITFNEQEIQLISMYPNSNEWYTRAWVAKESYGKSLGLGLQGNPKKYVIEEIDNNRLRINNTWITTKKHQNYIIGWT